MQQTIGFDLICETIAIYRDDNRAPLTDHIEQAVRDAVAATMRLGKASSIRLTLSVKPGAEENAIEFSADLAVTLPRPQTRPVTLFGDKTGKVFAEDPRQMRLTPPTPIARESAE